MTSRTYLYIEDKNALSLQSDENNFILDPDSEYGIDTVRSLIRWSIHKPFNAKYKIALLPHADQFGTEAQNALLKVIEETPQKTILILTTTNTSLLLPTILSRCTPLKTSQIQSKSVGEWAADIIVIPKDVLQIEPIPTFSTPREAMKLAERLAKKYSRAELKLFLERWASELLRTPTASNVYTADRYLTAREQLAHNTNPQLTLEVCFIGK